MAQVTYQVDDRVAVVTLQAPERGNSFNPDMRRELHHALVRFRDDDDAWVLVVSGDGADFCTGSFDEHSVAVITALNIMSELHLMRAQLAEKVEDIEK